MVATNRFTIEAQHDDEDGRAAFARVFAQHDRWLYAYLMTLLGKPSHAEEVFQEVCVVLWREYQKFDLDTNFMKWASVIALNQVRKFRRNLRRNEAWLSEGLLEVLADEAIEQADLLEARRRSLHECMGQLSDSDRQIVRECYVDSRTTIKQAAERLNRPANTLYKAMSRIRRALHDCITRRLKAEGFS